MNKTRPVVLFATPILHYPPIGGPALRIENSIKALSQISDLHLFSRVSLASLGGELALSFYEQYCKSVYFSPFAVSSNSYVNYAERAVNFLARRIIRRNIFRLGGESPKTDFAYLLKIAASIQADVIWLGYGCISYQLLKYIKQHSDYKVVVDTDSVWSQFILRELPYTENVEKYEQILQEGLAKEEEETWGTSLADVTTAVSLVDAEYYSNLAHDKRQIRIFSNVIDMNSYRLPPSAADGLKKPSIYLAGSFYAEKCPMSDAARWVINAILPLIRRQIPDIHFYIVGIGSDKVLSDIQDPGITVTGKLPSVLSYLCHVDVALVPLRFESGTRFKILEAGACGIPVVSTTLGAEGLPVTHQKDILIADDPENFSKSVVRLIRDRDFAITMAGNLKNIVQERASIDALVQEGKIILEYLDIL